MQIKCRETGIWATILLSEHQSNQHAGLAPSAQRQMLFAAVIIADSIMRAMREALENAPKSEMVQWLVQKRPRTAAEAQIVAEIRLSVLAESYLQRR